MISGLATWYWITSLGNQKQIKKIEAINLNEGKVMHREGWERKGKECNYILISKTENNNFQKVFHNICVTIEQASDAKDIL